jgi:hypothetical protein
MATKRFQQEVAEEPAGKGVRWGPAVAGGLAFGPLGALAGAIASVVIVASGGSSPPRSDDRGSGASGSSSPA